MTAQIHPTPRGISQKSPVFDQRPTFTLPCTTAGLSTPSTTRQNNQVHHPHAMIASSSNMLASDVPTHCPTGHESGDDVSTDGLSVSFSVTSTDEPDMEQRRNKREALRAKLRGAEKRLLQFTSSNTSGGGSGFLGQMAAVQADLKKVEEEKNQLEGELSKLRDSTGDDAFLNEKMSGIQEGFDKQVEKIRSLQEEVVTKDDEIERLHEELIEKLRRVVELEFDLETHEVHYTNYGT